MDFKPKLVAFDLDGTLAESKTPVTPAMADLLAQLLKHMPAAVLSGGSWQQFQNQFLTNFPDGAKLDRLYLFPTNAAVCYVHRGQWHPQYDHSFTDEQKKRILDAFSEAMAEVHFIQPEKTWGPQLEDRGGQITFSALGQQAPLEEKQKYDPDRTKRMPLAEALKKRLPDLSIGVNAATSIDVTPSGVNKAYGIRRLAELTGISTNEMLYVGDALGEGGNDSVVIETGVHTREVFGPDETEKVIQEILEQSPPAEL